MVGRLLSIPPEAFPTALRAHREKLGLTQADLAAYVGTTQWTICQWESGKATPSPYSRVGIIVMLACAGQKMRIKA